MSTVYIFSLDDHSRVVLELQGDLPGTDYINASWIDVSGWSYEECCTGTAVCMLYRDRCVHVIRGPLCACCTGTAVCMLYGDHCVHVIRGPLCACYTGTAVCMLYGDRCVHVIRGPLCACCTRTSVCMLYGDHCVHVVRGLPWHNQTLLHSPPLSWLVNKLLTRLVFHCRRATSRSGRTSPVKDHCLITSRTSGEWYGSIRYRLLSW